MDKHPHDKREPVVTDAKLQEALAQAQENHDKYLRARADLENLKKQSIRDREEFLRFRLEALYRELLSVVDHLQLAVDHAKGESTESNPIVAGVELVLKQFQGILERQGLKVIDALGKPFDPRVHEAIAHQESSAYSPNTVVVEHQTGYLIGHQVLRPSRVTVSKAPQISKIS